VLGRKRQDLNQVGPRPRAGSAMAERRPALMASAFSGCQLSPVERGRRAAQGEADQGRPSRWFSLRA
jgi:hypothetical protein